MGRNITSFIIVLYFKAIAYAGDIAIAALRIYPQTLSDKLNMALSIVLDWCRDFGLSINPSKTDTMLFTRRYMIPFPFLASVEPGSHLAEVKYIPGNR